MSYLRQSAFSTDWLCSDGWTRITDKQIDEMAMSVIYFELQGEDARAHIRELVRSNFSADLAMWSVLDIVFERIDKYRAATKALRA